MEPGLEERGGMDGKSWEDTRLDRVETGGWKRQNNYVEVVRRQQGCLALLNTIFDVLLLDLTVMPVGYSNAESEHPMNFTCFYTFPLLHYRTPASNFL